MNFSFTINTNMERFNFYLNNLDESWKSKFAAGFASILASGGLHGEGTKQSPNSTVIVHNDTQKEKTFHEHASELLKKHEGVRLKAYKDSKGNSTVGVGHMLTKESPVRFKTAFGDEGEKLHKHVIDGGSLTEEQSDKLLKADIDHHVERAKKLMPNFDKYPAEHRAHLLSGVYRGDLSGSPKTLKLINDGKFKEASKEYLNNKEYRESKKLGDKSGIHKRMDEVASHIGKLAEVKLEESPAVISIADGEYNINNARTQFHKSLKNNAISFHKNIGKIKGNSVHHYIGGDDDDDNEHHFVMHDKHTNQVIGVISGKYKSGHGLFVNSSDIHPKLRKQNFGVRMMLKIRKHMPVISDRTHSVGGMKMWSKLMKHRNAYVVDNQNEPIHKTTKNISTSDVWKLDGEHDSQKAGMRIRLNMKKKLEEMLKAPSELPTKERASARSNRLLKVKKLVDAYGKIPPNSKMFSNTVDKLMKGVNIIMRATPTKFGEKDSELVDMHNETRREAKQDSIFIRKDGKHRRQMKSGLSESLRSPAETLAKLEEMLKAPSEMSTFEGELNRKQRLDNIAKKTLKYHDMASNLKEKGSKQSNRVYGKFLKGMMIHGRANDEASVDARIKGKQIVKSLRKYDNLSLKESLRSPAETLAKTGDLEAAERRQRRLGAIKHVANTSTALFKRIAKTNNTDTITGNAPSVGEKIHLPATNISNQKIGNRASKANYIIGRVNTLGGDKSRKESKYRSAETRQFRVQRNLPDKWKVREQPDKKYLKDRINFKLQKLNEMLKSPKEIWTDGDSKRAKSRLNRLHRIETLSKDKENYSAKTRKNARRIYDRADDTMPTLVRLLSKKK
jgi:GH24 family phage-related lysozyme (muramidase)